MENVLLIASKYACDDKDSYLTDDLARALAQSGRKVLAVGYGYRTIQKVSLEGLLEETIVEVGQTPKYFKYLFPWLAQYLAVRRIVRDHQDISKIVFFAPLTLLWPAVLATLPSRCQDRTAIIFDIYPDHQVQIGSLPGVLSGILRAVERLLLRGCSEITGMSPANLKAIQRVYGDGVLEKRLKILPPWGSSKPIDADQVEGHFDRHPGGKVKFVFGGQIGRGRDLGKAIQFLALLRARGIEITLAVFTNEAGARHAAPYLGSHPWIELRKRIPRDEYLTTLAQFDFGLIVTDPQVDLPTVPSKIIDYVTARLRCICLLESASDLEIQLPFPDIIHVNHFAFDRASLEAAEKFISYRPSVLRDEFQMAATVLSVDTAVKTLMG